MPQPRTLDQKVGDTVQAFAVLREELNPAALRGLVTSLTVMIPEKNERGETSADAMQAYASLVQSSMSIARIVSANDRTAMIASAMLTQSGVSRPTFNPDEE